MQIKIEQNIKQFSKRLTNFEKTQMPFAIATGINSTLFGLKKEMSKQAEKKLDRPTPATKKGFFVKKANKKKQFGFLAIKDFVAEYLKYQIDGGVRSTGKKIPVPYTKNIRLNKYGNIIGKKSGLIKNPAKQFIAKIGGVSGVYQRFGSGGKQSKLIIAFKDSVTYRKKPFKFYTIGTSYINNTYNRNLDKAFKKAMATARRK
tara:strand:+ start:776 stop:1384 length:609 start_codon:yes stop_codon:yes gene_type:complete